MSARRRLPVLLLALAVLGAPVPAAHALDICRCANGEKIRTTRDCASACRGFGGNRTSNEKDRAQRRQRQDEEQQERQADAETDRAIRARDEATPPLRRPRSVPAAPANVTSVDPSRPVTNGAGVACLDGKVLIPSQPTSDQIAFCKNR